MVAAAQSVAERPLEPEGEHEVAPHLGVRDELWLPDDAEVGVDAGPIDDFDADTRVSRRGVDAREDQRVREEVP